MSSAVKVILGVSVLAMTTGFAACDSGSSVNDPGPAGGPKVVTAGGSGNSGSVTPGGGGADQNGGGAGNLGTGGTGDAPNLPEGVPLTPLDGWVAGDSNEVHIQGAMIAYADDTSSMGMVSTLTGSNACISGTAALVDMMSTACTTKVFKPPAMDCYGEYWGAAIGLNLNQPTDPATGMGGVAMPYDATALKGFAFVVSGNTVPAPKDFRFKVENASGEFCNIPTKKVTLGVNTFLFSDLVGACYKITEDPPNPVVTPAVQSSLLKISWQVVTNDKGTVPFDFCISDVRALLASGTPVGNGSGGAGGASGGSAGASGGAGGASGGVAGAGGGSAGASAGSAGASGASGGSGGTAGTAG